MLQNSKFGCYVTSDRKLWATKLEAVTYAAKNNVAASFYYHNHLWDSLLAGEALQPGRALKRLYLERAEQLRQTYGYLVLHYSGGSDSHNVLMTFLNNKIKLDEVIVKWSPKPKDLGLYSPSTDPHPRNSLSEWDLTIKPTLDWLAKEHPQVKITVVDFLEDLYAWKANVEDMIKKISVMSLPRSAFGSVVQRYSQATEDAMLKNRPSTGRAAHIFGIEKPILSNMNGCINMHFSDAGFETSVLIDTDLRSSAEAFYWTPDLPQLALEQARQTAILAKFNPQVRKVLFTDSSLSPEESIARRNAQSALFRSVLYRDTWDLAKFQANKPNATLSDWWWWLHELEDFSSLKVSYDTAVAEMKNASQSADLFKSMSTKPFPILKL